MPLFGYSLVYIILRREFMFEYFFLYYFHFFTSQFMYLACHFKLSSSPCLNIIITFFFFF